MIINWNHHRSYGLFTHKGWMIKIEKVTFISPDLPFPTLATHAFFAEFGMPFVATIVRDAGYDVRVFVEHIGPVKWDLVIESDVVCFHTFSASMPTTVEYIKMIRAYGLIDLGSFVMGSDSDTVETIRKTGKAGTSASPTLCLFDNPLTH